MMASKQRPSPRSTLEDLRTKRLSYFEKTTSLSSSQGSSKGSQDRKLRSTNATTTRNISSPRHKTIDKDRTFVGDDSQQYKNLSVTNEFRQKTRKYSPRKINSAASPRQLLAKAKEKHSSENSPQKINNVHNFHQQKSRIQNQDNRIDKVKATSPIRKLFVDDDHYDYKKDHESHKQKMTYRMSNEDDGDGGHDEDDDEDDDVALEIWGIKDDVKSGNLDLEKYIGHQAHLRKSKPVKPMETQKSKKYDRVVDMFFNSDADHRHVKSNKQRDKMPDQKLNNFFGGGNGFEMDRSESPMKSVFKPEKLTDNDLDNLGLHTHRPEMGDYVNEKSNSKSNTPLKSSLKKSVDNPEIFDGLDYEGLRGALGEEKFKEFVEKSMKDVSSLQEQAGKPHLHRKVSQNNTPVKNEKQSVTFKQNSPKVPFDNDHGSKTEPQSSIDYVFDNQNGLIQGRSQQNVLLTPTKQFKVLEAQQSVIQSDLHELGLSTHRPSQVGSRQSDDVFLKNDQSSTRARSYGKHVQPQAKAAFSVDEIYKKVQNLKQFEQPHLGNKFYESPLRLDQEIFGPPKFESLFFEQDGKKMLDKSPRRSGGHQRTVSAPETPRDEHVEAIRKHHEHKRQLSTDLFHTTGLSPAYSNSSLDRYFSSLQDIPRDNASVFSSDNFEPIPEPILDDSDPEHGIWLSSPAPDEEGHPKTARELNEEPRPESVTERLERMGIDLAFLRNSNVQSSDKVDKTGKDKDSTPTKKPKEDSTPTKKPKETLTPTKNTNQHTRASPDDPLAGATEHKALIKHEELEEISKPKLVKVCPECAGLNKPHITWCLECGCVLMGVEPVPVKPKKVRNPPKTHHAISEVESNAAKFDAVVESKNVSSGIDGRDPRTKVREEDRVIGRSKGREEGRVMAVMEDAIWGEVKEKKGNQGEFRQPPHSVQQFLNEESGVLGQLKRDFKVDRKRRQKPAWASVKPNESENSPNDNFDWEKPKTSEHRTFEIASHEDINQKPTEVHYQPRVIQDVDLSLDLSPSPEPQVDRQRDRLISDSGHHINEPENDEIISKSGLHINEYNVEIDDDGDFDMFDRRLNATAGKRNGLEVPPVPSLDLDLSNSSSVLQKEKHKMDSKYSKWTEQQVAQNVWNSHGDSLNNNFVKINQVEAEGLNQQSVGRTLKPAKSKTGAILSKSKGKRPLSASASSKVKQSIDADPYTRHWASSSIAWSSYNPRELNTRASQDLRKSKAGERPSSGKAMSTGSGSRPGSGTGGLSNAGRESRSSPLRKSHLRGVLSSGNSTGSSVEREYSSDGANSKQRHATYNQVQHQPSSSSPPKSVRRNVLDTYRRYNEMSPRILGGEMSMWECLPDEILLHIFWFLSREDIVQVARVNRQFYRVALDSYNWNNITLIKRTLCDEWLNEIGRHRPSKLNLIKCQGERYDGESVTNKGLRDLFANCAERLTTLNFSGCSKGQLAGDAILLHASTHCKNITELDASWCNVSDSGVAAICDSCHRLESITLNGCTGITDSSVAIVVQKHGKSLTHFGLFGCFNITPRGIQVLGDQCKFLRSLSLGQCYKLTDVCLGDLSRNLTSVECLDLRGCKQVKDNCVRKITRNCKNLQSLTLANCTQITDNTLTDIAVQLPFISMLDVSGCKHISDAGVRALSNSCTSLLSIDLSSTAITHKSINMLASYCNRYLESVKASFCKDITEGSLIKLAKHCRRLKILHIYGCKGLKNLSKVKDENPRLEIECDGQC